MGTEKESETEGTTGQESKRQTEGKMKREKEREREVLCVLERGGNTSLCWKWTKGNTPQRLNCWQALFYVQ